MPDSPDFEQIATLTVNDPAFREHGALLIMLALRRIWNARGAADIAIVDAEIDARIKRLQGLHADQPDRRGLFQIRDDVKKLDR